jgi:GTPase SAR1 family protein
MHTDICVRVRLLSGETGMEIKCSRKSRVSELLHQIATADKVDDPFTRRELLFDDRLLDGNSVLEDICPQDDSDCIDVHLVKSRHDIKECKIQEHDCTFKIFITGAIAAGKSSLLRRYCDGTWHDVASSDFGTKSLLVNDTKRVKLDVVIARGRDAAGADAVAVAFDLTDRRSFEVAVRHFSVFKTYSKNGHIIVLVGCKADLEESRQISAKEAQDFATREGISYFEVSARKNDSVATPFHVCLCALLENHKTSQESVSTVRLPKRFGFYHNLFACCGAIFFPTQPNV